MSIVKQNCNRMCKLINEVIYNIHEGLSIYEAFNIAEKGTNLNKDWLSSIKINFYKSSYTQFK